MIESGLILFIGILVVMGKTPKSLLKKILGYDYIVDIIVSVGVGVAMYGTYSGMMAAAVAGIAISAAMFLAKRIVGFQRYERGEGWVEYVPRWRNQSHGTG